MDQNPTVKNPEQGFLSSANQESTDSTYPYYINWHFGSYTRGKRINDKLRAMHHATADSLRLLQTDDYSIFAEDILATMLGDLDRSKMSDQQKQVYQTISKWDKQYSANSIGASIFDLWWDNLYNAIWEDDFTVKKDLNIQLKWPSNYRTIELLVTQKNSRWYDDSRTSLIETRADLINRSFDAAVDTLVRKYGKPGAAWQWGAVKGSNIAHLGNVPGFGSGIFSAGGAAGVINALSDTHGPSWRMVVQFGPRVQGYGVFPGGESGNPGSYYYDDMFSTWKNGQLNPLLFLENATDDAAHIKTTLTLSNK
jgi:penicillin amidase